VQSIISFLFENMFHILRVPFAVIYASHSVWLWLWLWLCCPRTDIPCPTPDPPPDNNKCPALGVLVCLSRPSVLKFSKRFYDRRNVKNLWKRQVFLFCAYLCGFQYVLKRSRINVCRKNSKFLRLAWNKTKLKISNPG